MQSIKFTDSKKQNYKNSLNTAFSTNDIESAITIVKGVFYEKIEHWGEYEKNAINRILYISCSVNPEIGISFFQELKNFENVIDEKLALSGIRLMILTQTTSKEIFDFVQTVFNDIGPTRRLFTPLLEYCAKNKNICTVQELFRFGISKQIEFNEVDFEYILESFSNTDAIDEIFFQMNHITYITENTVSILQKLFNEEFSSCNISDCGECPKCKNKMFWYAFTNDAR